MPGSCFFRSRALRLCPKCRRQPLSRVKSPVRPNDGKTACDYQRDGKTTVLEICCTRELGDPFRCDALRKPVRLLQKYRDFV